MAKKSKLIKCFLLSVLTTILFLYIMDLALGALGFPSDTSTQASHPPNFHETRTSIHDFTYTFTTNSQGLRCREIPLIKRSAGEKRIFVTGDSFVEGIGVEIEDTFVSKIEQEGNIDATIINGGLAATGPFEQVRLLCCKGFKYNPDIVLFCIYANDVSNTPDTTNFHYDPLIIKKKDGPARVIHSLWPRIYTLFNTVKTSRRGGGFHAKSRDIIAEVSKEAIQRGFSEESIRLWEEKLPTELVEAANRFELNGSILSSALLSPNTFKESLDIDTASAKIRLGNMMSILDYGLKECRKRNIKVAVVYIPHQLQYNPEKHSSYIKKKLGCNFRKEWLSETTSIQSEVKNWTTRNKLPFLDLTDTFRQAVKDEIGNLNFEYDAHWTPLGHKVAAEKISEWILDKHLIEN